MKTAPTLEAKAALAAVRRSRAAVQAAELDAFREVLAWCDLHVVSNLEDAATWGESAVLLAGEGAPPVQPPGP